MSEKACSVCGGTGSMRLLWVVGEIVHMAPVPCGGPAEDGCPARTGEDDQWKAWREYLAARRAVLGIDEDAYAGLLRTNLALRTWRGQFHDRKTVGVVVAGDREAQWVTCYVRVAREQPRGAPVADGDLPGIVELGRRCEWDPGKAVPDERRYRAELAASEGRRDAAAKVRELARGMVP